jgi:hypothetical protein
MCRRGCREQERLNRAGDAGQGAGEADDQQEKLECEQERLNRAGDAGQGAGEADDQQEKLECEQERLYSERESRDVRKRFLGVILALF